MLDEMLKISKIVRAADLTINAIDRTVNLGLRVYDRIEKHKEKQAKKAQQAPPNRTE
jgi:hypothetical protein